MTRYAIGDVQGCYEELRALVERIGFRADCDQLWFVGDLVNRGPRSLQVLRYVRSLGGNAVSVLGNHDLHLLGRAFSNRRKPKSDDTLDDVLAAPDCDALLEWLLNQPLVHFEARATTRARGDLIVHGGLLPQWSAEEALWLAGEVEQAMRTETQHFFEYMYGNEPSAWDPDLQGPDRLRFIVNALTRMRVCTAEGRIDHTFKGELKDVQAPYRAWFEFEDRKSRDVRVIVGHWAALGYFNEDNVVALDTACVWGDRLTAFNLDADAAPVSVPCNKR